MKLRLPGVLVGPSRFAGGRRLAALQGRWGWVVFFLGPLALAAWTRWPRPVLLLVAAGTGVLAAGAGRRRALPFRAGGLCLLLGTLAGFAASSAGGVRGAAWTDWTRREEELSHVLSRRFDDLLRKGERAVEAASVLLAEGREGDLSRGLSRIRRGSRMAALAVYGPDGELRSWVGVHRGQVPPDVRRGERRYAFGGGPLFRYLYFTQRMPEREGTLVAAALLQAEVPGHWEGGGLAGEVQRETGVPVRIVPPDRPAVWDLRWGGEPLLGVALGVEGMGDVPGGGWGRRPVGALGLLAWGAFAVGTQGLPGAGGVATLSLVAGALLVPVREGVGLGEVASPARFLLPGPLEGTLGRVLLVLGALLVAAGLGDARGRGGETGGSRGEEGQALGRGVWMALWVGVFFPLVASWFKGASSPDLFRVGVAGWLLYQGALAAALALVGWLGLRVVGRGTPPERGGAGSGTSPFPFRWWPALLGGICLGLALAGASAARVLPGLPAGTLVLWAGPAFLVGWGASQVWGSGRGGAWLACSLLGATAGAVSGWGTLVEARLRLVEASLQEMGGEADPFLEFRLARMAERADSLGQVVRVPVELLYETWSQAVPREEPLPMWLTLWSAGGFPLEDLAVGVRGPRPSVAGAFLEVVEREGRPLIRNLGMADARYLLAVPLAGGRILTAVVPPPGSPAVASVLGPIFATKTRVGGGVPRLVPLRGPGEEAGWVGVKWERHETGWQARRWIRFPAEGEEAVYLATQTLPLADPLHLVARGTLTLLLDLGFLLGLWGTGRGLGGGRSPALRRLLRAAGTFRGRVTLALFGFFLLSVAIFGTLAFQTLAGAAQRTASAVARRVVEDGSGFYLEVQGNLQQLGRQVGGDLLRYRGGELWDGSSEALVQLGLFEGWVPEPIFRALEGGVQPEGLYPSALGSWEYVMAYRRLPDGAILASPVPVEAGAMALRRQEVADLLGLAIVLGAFLSLALAFWVGRALTRPLDILQVASERVGSGNLGVRLPDTRHDEFGAVFGAFNRMVGGIRQARRALLRTSRRTRAIVEHAATGVVALDRAGRIALVNERAKALFRGALREGLPMEEADGRLADVAAWLKRLQRDELSEGTTEIQVEGRRIRVRARHLSEGRVLEGVVLSLEDVTDELRTERILAWGEMARQVAHEVKNPLTPMKLSVQHLLRAWEDGHPAFDSILRRNVEVILREIDRLAAIARSFARFAAPSVSGQSPLVPVDVAQVVEEVAGLYGGGGTSQVFVWRVPPDLPRVSSRELELREVLVNLLENARAAISDTGTVVVEAEASERGVELRVRDNGAGIPPEFLPRIFEPYFSTRSSGTGLGLAIVKRLVESWGGAVTVESRLGEGTLVRVFLPRWLEGEEARG